jgi:hypothetical protein
MEIIGIEDMETEYDHIDEILCKMTKEAGILIKANIYDERLLRVVSTGADLADQQSKLGDLIMKRRYGEYHKNPHMRIIKCK